MYGKIFESLYAGSMVGQGALMFAVWGYVIANMKPDKDVGAQVEINPRLLCAILGEEQADVASVVEKLCAPDPDSRTKDEEGRRLVRIGQFSYRVVNGPKYMSIRNEEARRAQTRQATERWREKAKIESSVLLNAGQQRRAERAKRKPAAAKALEAEVRSKHNPGYVQRDPAPTRDDERGLPAGMLVKKRVDELLENEAAAKLADPIASVDLSR